MTPVASVDNRVPRPPVIGKIRLGVYDKAKGSPRTTDTFVFTSPDAYYLLPLAKMWGGTPERFIPQGQTIEQWRLVTETREIAVLFPFAEGRLNIDTWRELYGSGHIKRRCDEITAQVYTEPEGHLVPEPCVCEAQGRVECDLITRIRVWIPSTGLGCWELQTRSVNAAFSLPDDIGLLEAYFGDELNRIPVSMTLVPRRTTRLDNRTGKRVPTTVTIVSIRLAVPFLDAQTMIAEGHHPAELMAGGRPALGTGADPAGPADSADERPAPGRDVPGGGRRAMGKGSETTTPAATSGEVDAHPGTPLRPSTEPDHIVAGGEDRAATPASTAPPAASTSEAGGPVGATRGAGDPQPSDHRFRGDDPNAACLVCGYLIEAHGPQGRS